MAEYYPKPRPVEPPVPPVAWVVLAAVVVALVVGGFALVTHRTGEESLTAESMREITAAQREGREWHPDDGQPWIVRHPPESAAATFVLVLVVGSLVVIAVNTSRPPEP